MVQVPLRYFFYFGEKVCICILLCDCWEQLGSDTLSTVRVQVLNRSPPVYQTVEASSNILLAVIKDEQRLDNCLVY